MRVRKLKTLISRLFSIGGFSRWGHMPCNLTDVFWNVTILLDAPNTCLILGMNKLTTLFIIMLGSAMNSCFSNVGLIHDPPVKTTRTLLRSNWSKFGWRQIEAICEGNMLTVTGCNQRINLQSNQLALKKDQVTYSPSTCRWLQLDVYHSHVTSSRGGRAPKLLSRKNWDRRHSRINWWTSLCSRRTRIYCRFRDSKILMVSSVTIALTSLTK